VTSTYKEAWATGWEVLTAVSATVGTGSGQFPTAAQALTTGHLVIRKSVTADGTGRAWQLFADASTFYLFVSTGDAAGLYFGFWFGDVFSMKGNTDAYRCFIIGRAVENSAGSSNSADTMMGFHYVTVNLVGSFIARTIGGGGASILIGKHGDLAKLGGGYANSFFSINGLQQTPNGPDSSYYLSPIWVHEGQGLGVSGLVRGRLRGIYHICHPITSFSDGQTFAGANDFAGKTFQVVRGISGYDSGTTPSGIAVEISATVETN
jgi:hypothetical protein